LTGAKAPPPETGSSEPASRRTIRILVTNPLAPNESSSEPEKDRGKTGTGQEQDRNKRGTKTGTGQE
ncbi:MAG: hypothetical protein ABIK65_06510, partial [Candidatus Eisenbacteria bacterium]